MVNTNSIGLLFILFMCIIIRKTYSLENDEQDTMDDIVMEPQSIKDTPVLVDENPSMDNPIDIQTSAFLNNRRSESAEKYFDWVRKTQRPVEYLRGKRFWLFAKKDEHDMNIDLIPNTKTQQSSLTQGLWRSGIVGRRRR